MRLEYVVKKATLALALALVMASCVQAQETELFSCLPDTAACFESPGELAAQSCGEDFYFHRGRLSWPALMAVGPITISVLTKTLTGDNPLPLYVQIVRDLQTASCSTGDAIVYPLIVTRGLPQCGGVWKASVQLTLPSSSNSGSCTAYRLSSWRGILFLLFVVLP